MTGSSMENIESFQCELKTVFYCSIIAALLSDFCLASVKIEGL
jgi:hypothetical protein